MIAQSVYPGDPRITREAEALERAGYIIDIICLRKDNESNFERLGNINVYRILDRQFKENIYNYLKLSLNFLLSSSWKLNYLSKKNKYSLIQVHNLPDFLIFSTFFQKIKGIPIILDLHDLTPELFKSKWGSRRHHFLYTINVVLEKLSCSYADHIITTSEGFVKKLIVRGVKESKVSLIINAPSNIVTRKLPPKYSPALNKELKIVYHGTIINRFGLHIAINAMTAILEKIPNSVLHIYGVYDESYRKELEELIKSLDLEETVKLFGFLPLEQIAEKVQEYHIGIVPYIESEFMHLAISTKSFEYAKLGIPMVASDLKSARYYFNDESISYFKPGDSNEFAEKIIELCLTPNLMEIRAKNARNSISHIFNGKVEKKYVGLINQLNNY